MGCLSYSCPQRRGRRHWLPSSGYPCQLKAHQKFSGGCMPWCMRLLWWPYQPLVDSTVVLSSMPPVSSSLTILTIRYEQGFLRGQHPLSHLPAFCASFGLPLIPGLWAAEPGSKYLLQVTREDGSVAHLGEVRDVTTQREVRRLGSPLCSLP